MSYTQDTEVTLKPDLKTDMSCLLLATLRDSVRTYSLFCTNRLATAGAQQCLVWNHVVNAWLPLCREVSCGVPG